MDRAAKVAAATALGWLCMGCGSDVDEAGASQLWEQIHAEDYRSWDRPPGWETAQPTIRAHGETAEIFINSVMAGALSGSSLSEWPSGSILVKDGFDGGDRSLIAAMEKQSDEWFFAEWDASGAVKFAGRPDVCLNCHREGADFVFSAALP